ncbi:ATP-binding protein [Pseudonocardia sp. DSM 110487]|nr:ATP-binding protein [Pseudonocardia sp. DSM 110487]
MRFPPAWIDDLIFITSEAISNAAEHAYPPDTAEGPIHVEARLRFDTEPPSRPEHPEGRARPRWRVQVRVADRGAWKPVNPAQGHRGHGLAAIAALAAHVTVRRGEQNSPRGTELTITSAPAPRN